MSVGCWCSLHQEEVLLCFQHRGYRRHWFHLVGELRSQMPCGEAKKGIGLRGVEFWDGVS